MSSDALVVGCAASSLASALLDGPERDLVQVARTRASVHYETGDDEVPVLTLCTPSAVRLPAALVTPVLPSHRRVALESGGIRQGARSWRVTRWWRPERPVGLRPVVRDVSSLLPGDLPADRAPVPAPTYHGLRPARLLGQGPGLTPSGDDLVAAALVTAHATGDERFGRWRSETRRALSGSRTTAVSRALLHHACDGYATRELAAALRAVCSGRDPAAARADLLAVGHSSGAALLAGLVHTLSTRRPTPRLEGVA